MPFLSRIVPLLSFKALLATAFLTSIAIGQEAPRPDTPAKPVEASPKPDVKAEATTPKPVEAAKKESASTVEKTPSVKSEESKPTPNQAAKPAEQKPAQNDKGSKPKAKDGEKKPSNNKPVDPNKIPLDKIGSNMNDFIPGQPWRIHDMKRPRPKAVQPGKNNNDPPADARVLFDGKDLSEWYHPGIDDEAFVPMWRIRDGYFEIEPKSGSIVTIDSFGSCQLHIEWMIPEGTTGSSQGRGNSGIKLMERYEVQVLDSFNNRTYADGQAGAVYGQFPPLVNASREQGQWQTYDIFFEAPTYEAAKMVKPPFVTVVHNGILVQNHAQLTGPTGLKGSPSDPVPPAAPLMLQDHNNRIRFRNIWIRELP